MIFVARLADNIFCPLPRSLTFLYYFLRPLRLAGKWSWLWLSAGFRGLRRRLHFSPE
jgi:predicted small integral membrane protein